MCLHIQFVSQFFNIKWSIYPYLPGIKHLYLIYLLPLWLVIDWWSLLWSMIHICWILALKVDPTWKRGVKEKNIPKEGHENIILLLHFLIEDVSVDKCSKNLNDIFCFKEFTSVPKNGQFQMHIAKLRDVPCLRNDISRTVWQRWMILFLREQLLV